MKKMTSLPITPLGYGLSSTSMRRSSTNGVAIKRSKSANSDCSAASSYGTQVPRVAGIEGSVRM